MNKESYPLALETDSADTILDFPLKDDAEERRFLREYLQEHPTVNDNADRISAILDTYATDILPPAAINQVVRAKKIIDNYEIVGRQDPSREAASWMLGKLLGEDEFFDLGDQNAQRALCSAREYRVSLLGDMDVIDKTVNQWHDNLDKDKSRSGVVDLQRRLAGNLFEPEPLEAEVWLVTEPHVDIKSLRNLCTEVNLESIIIKAAECLDDLARSGHGKLRDLEAFRSVMEIESSYAPLCEAIGFDAFAMKLRSEALITRLERGGNGRYVDRAKTILEQANQFDLSALMATVTSEPLLLDDDQAWTYRLQDPQCGSAQTDIFPEINYGMIDPQQQLADNPDRLWQRCFMRFKSIGSLAKKILSHEAEGKTLPLDIVGLTLEVDENSGSVAQTFTDLIERLSTDPAIKLVNAPSKQKACFAQGCTEFLRPIQDALEDRNLAQSVETKTKEGAREAVYNVAKVTFEMTDQAGQTVSCEVQVIDSQERKDARTGASSHLIYKMPAWIKDKADIAEWKKLLQEIYERKQRIGGEAVNGQSRKRGQEYCRDLKSRFQLVGQQALKNLTR